MYTTTFILDEDNYESYNGTTNDVWWGENGATTWLLNIIITIEDVGMEAKFTIQEQDLKNLKILCGNAQ